MRIEEFLENFRILIVDMLDIVLFEETLFAHNFTLIVSFLI